jgi:hypothetical protein
VTANTDRLALGGRVAGSRVVLAVYLAVLGVAGTMGALLGYVNPEGLNPTLFFLVDLPATPLGMATFGVVTVGVGLGVLLLAVRYVSRYDERRIEYRPATGRARAPRRPDRSADGTESAASRTRQAPTGGRLGGSRRIRNGFGRVSGHARDDTEIFKGRAVGDSG